jgi:hypothetical protein
VAGKTDIVGLLRVAHIIDIRAAKWPDRFVVAQHPDTEALRR